MKIICDTNVWYKLGTDPETFEKVKNEPLCPTHVNIYELSKTINVIKNEDEVRAAIQRMFHFKNRVIFEPPHIYIAGLYKEIEYDVLTEMGTYLTFTEKFASGEKIRAEKFDEFRNFSIGISEAFKAASTFINNVISERKTKIQDKRVHKLKNMVPFTYTFLNFFIKKITQDSANLDNVEDLSGIELLMRTLGVYLNLLERSTAKIQPNDWFDFLQLGYVQPGDKYWTYEKKWLNRIEEAGMEEYLFQPQI